MEETFSSLGKPMPFFVPHQIHSHHSSEHVAHKAAPINVQELEQQTFREEEEPVQSDEDEGPQDPKPTPTHDDQEQKWGQEDSDDEKAEAAQEDQEERD